MKSAPIPVTLLAVLLAMLLAMAASVQPLAAQGQPDGQKPVARRLALLIGNRNYSKFRPLPAVSTEMDLVNTALAASGFQITRVDDASNEALTKATDGFVAGVQKGDICLIYFSGYAAQDPDDDLLIPTDFDPGATELDSNNAYPLTKLAKDLGDKQAAFKMFFIEGARRRDDVIIRKANPGLRLLYTGDLREILFAIPTTEGNFVDTPADQPGLFTKALVDFINSEKPLTEFQLQVLSAVSKQRASQQPKTDNLVTQAFYFHHPKEPAPTRQRSQNHTDREFYVWIPPGTFKMGCVPGAKCDPEEQPRHDVTITKGFWMGENEVQVESYSKFVAMSSTKDGKKRKMPAAVFPNNWRTGGDHPINNMTWEDAQDYCSWAGGKLPTEAQWEYAARGGKPNQIYPFDPTDLEKSREGANFKGRSGNDRYDDTAPVKRFNANEFGLYDMAGNVWEVVADFWGTYSDSPAENPEGPPTGRWHVRRGGSYDSIPEKHMRISYREPFKEHWPNNGFRCVMDDSEATTGILKNP